jgi:hypothetical protein
MHFADRFGPIFLRFVAFPWRPWGQQASAILSTPLLFCQNGSSRALLVILLVAAQRPTIFSAPSSEAC